jgi:hypothetical protein
MKSSLRLQQISASVSVALNGKVVEMKARGEILLPSMPVNPIFLPLHPLWKRAALPS